MLSTNETQFELSNNSLKKRRLTRELENLKQALKSKKVQRALLQKKLIKNELKREAGELEKKLKKLTNKNNKKILNSSIVVDLSYIKLYYLKHVS